MSFIGLKSETSAITVGGGSAFWIAKRSLDILVALILIPPVIVIGIFVWVLNFWFNAGPLIYVQTRYGRDMKLFSMFKFRTMQGQSGESKFASDETHRISKFGSLLRKLHIDETPQIFNILTGEMSLIGPRPEQKKFVQEYLLTIPNYNDRHMVRPGITGLAQVEHGYTDDEQGARLKLDLDMQYIRACGFWMDAKILGKTAYLLLTKTFNKSG